MERMRVRFNRAMTKAILDLEFCYFKFPDMEKMSLFLAQDGVHLLPLGNTVFLNTLQDGLAFFASGKGSVYLDCYVSFKLCNYIVYLNVQIVLAVSQLTCGLYPFVELAACIVTTVLHLNHSTMIQQCGGHAHKII